MTTRSYIIPLMSRRAVTGSLLITIAAMSAVDAGPNRYGHSDRVERHMLPAVSTGPLDPAWSPDGKWIAFSMRGDIWKVPAEGGDAVALTRGPAYHFEPSWSPDGSRIALSMDVDGNLDIGVVSAGGGDVERLTTDRRVDVEPTWSRDGRMLYFVTARGGNFDIYRYRFADRSESLFIGGPRDQIQPAESPDGTRLAYVNPVDGRLGTGGIWLKPVAGGDATLVHYEETEYRARPAWTPDGQSLLFSSDEPGSNDIAIVSAAGGNPVYLSADAMNEFAPTVSPDGTRFAFVSNRTGPTTLYVVPIGGGPIASWLEVALTSRKPASPTGRVRGRVLGPDGQLTSARIYPLAADKRAYAPDRGFHRVIAATETHYFHTDGSFELEVPAGAFAVEAMKGFEYQPVSATVQVPAGGAVDVTLRLSRLVDAPARGWYSGDTHIHDLHQGRFGLSHEEFFNQLTAEDGECDLLRICRCCRGRHMTVDGCRSLRSRNSRSSGTVPVPHGGWIAARVVGPSSRYVTDSYAFAQTSPVYVVRDGKPFTSAEDATFLRDVVDAIWARVDGQQTRWRTPAARETFKAAIDQARAVYDAIAKR